MSDLICGTRLGFSGTPTDLLPASMLPVRYELAADASVIRALTSDQVITVRPVDDWTVLKLLSAASEPRYSALIDAGALVVAKTLRSNKAAAWVSTATSCSAKAKHARAAH